jgi:hypothetical protein
MANNGMERNGMKKEKMNNIKLDKKITSFSSC